MTFTLLTILLLLPISICLILSYFLSFFTKNRVIHVSLILVIVFLYFLPLVWHPPCPTPKEAIKYSKTGSQLDSYLFNCNLYKTDNGKFPDNLDQIIRIVPKKNVLENPKLDSWGNPIIFEPFDKIRGYGLIISHGSDGFPGGEGFAKDIRRKFGEPIPQPNKSKQP